MDITGPWYWWKQFEQYKIGTTTNSESSIHAINKRGFTLNDFSTVTMSYENALNIIQWRSNHKLDEWRTLCDILINELPYMKEFYEANVKE